jgi:hypothetical protein
MEYSKQGHLLTQALAVHPSGFPVASNGDLYFVTEAGTLCLIHDHVVSTLLTGVSTPEGLAIDGNGNVFFDLYGNPNSAGHAGDIMEYSAGQLTTVVNGGLWRVHDIALGPSGSVYFVEESNYDDQGNSGTLARFVPGAGVETLLYDIDYPEGLAVAADGTVYFTAERGNITDAGTILFRYNPQYSDALAQVSVTSVGNSGNAIIIGQGTATSPTLSAGSLKYTLDPAQSASAECFVVLSRSLVYWTVDTTVNLAMPGSWSPLPQINVTAGGQNVSSFIYRVRKHQGARWPATIENGIEIPAAGFSEQPLALVVAFGLPSANGPQEVNVVFPANN